MADLLWGWILYFLNSNPPPPQLLATTILFFFFSIIVCYRILSVISVLYTIGPYCLPQPFFFFFFWWVWFLDTSCKWNHAMFVFKIYSCCPIAYCRINIVWIDSIVCMHIFSFIHSSIVGHLGHCHVLAFLDNAAVNMGVQIPPQDPDFVLYILCI